MTGALQSEPLALLAGLRTPFLRAFGSLLGVEVDSLARFVLHQAAARAAIDTATLDEVIVGCAGQPVAAMNVARVAALRAGIPEHVPAFTVHRNCASGFEVLAQAWQRVRAGNGDLFLVAGAESMSEAPFQARPEGARALVKLSRARTFAAKAKLLAGTRIADLLPRPTLEAALTDPVSGLLMGNTAELLARELRIPRDEQDAFAARSHSLALAAKAAGRFAEEIVEFAPPPDFEELHEHDDGIRDDATPERLARLRPIFDRRFGTVTVGNSCQLTDGAGAFVAASRGRAEQLGQSPLGYLVDTVAVGCDPRRMGLGPAIAIPRLLERNSLAVSDVDVFEINEAFAVQVLACLRQMGAGAPPLDVLNVNGGAIALGHPVGATGVRLVLSALLELRRRGGKRAIVSACVGGGQGVAALIATEEGLR
jgi:acetyl-CoA acetyltransferase family protein